MRFDRIFLLFTAILLSFSLTSCSVSASGSASAVSAAERVTREDFLEKVSFLGDSTTAHMQSRAAVKSEAVWATANRFLNLDARITYAKIVCPATMTEMTIAETAAVMKPPILVITLGIDYGVYYYRNKPESFTFYYEKLLDAISAASPETVLVLQSIFPVGRESVAITNEMVDRANLLVADIAARRGLVYLDANSNLKDSEGYLRPDFCSSADGIHLTEAAYRKILENLTAHADEILEKL